MKKIITRGLVTASISTALFIGCADSPVSQESPKDVVGIETQNTALTVIVKNTETKELMNDVTVSFGGELGTKVVNGTDSSITSASIQGGLGDFYVDTTGYLFVQANAEGFLSSSKKINIQDGVNVITLNLLPIATESKIVEIVVVKDIPVQTDGSLAEALVIETSTDAAVESQIEVTIPAGVKMINAAGTPVVGKIEVSVIAADLEEEGALDVFPASFTVSKPENEAKAASKKEEGAIITAGFAKIEIKDEAGNLVKTFSEPIDVFIKIDQAMVNPQTGAVVKDGETIEIWSLSEGQVEWQFEGTEALVTKDGVLGVIAKVSHLSYYSAAFYNKRPCKGNEPTISINDAEATFSATISNDGYTGTSTAKGTITLNNFPSTSVSFKGDVKYQGQSINTFNKKFKCGEDYAVTLPDVETFNVSINSKVRCSNSTDLTFAYPSASVTLFAGTELLNPYLADSLGNLNVTLPAGTYTYKVRNKWTNETEDDSFTVPGDLDNIMFFDRKCTVGTGSVSF
jgi:hypothetical protein